MGNRKLVEFNMTREEIPPTPDHDWKRETPYVASMANEELRIGPETDHARFQKVLILGEQMIELANPGMAAMDTGPLDGCERSRHRMHGDRSADAVTVAAYLVSGPEDHRTSVVAGVLSFVSRSPRETTRNNVRALAWKPTCDAGSNPASGSRARRLPGFRR